MFVYGNVRRLGGGGNDAAIGGGGGILRRGDGAVTGGAVQNDDDEDGGRYAEYSSGEVMMDLWAYADHANSGLLLLVDIMASDASSNYSSSDERQEVDSDWEIGCRCCHNHVGESPESFVNPVCPAEYLFWL